mmetsp:Transcript_36750/g.65738  ORF Transcript_36750/g.65738 Transcript_36750/m.65738 type:complete len:85 (-) Transcript_36750:275-529(-)
MHVQILYSRDNPTSQLLVQCMATTIWSERAAALQMLVFVAPGWSERLVSISIKDCPLISPRRTAACVHHNRPVATSVCYLLMSP